MNSSGCRATALRASVQSPVARRNSGPDGSLSFRPPGRSIGVNGSQKGQSSSSSCATTSGAGVVRAHVVAAGSATQSRLPRSATRPCEHVNVTQDGQLVLHSPPLHQPLSHTQSRGAPCFLDSGDRESQQLLAGPRGLPRATAVHSHTNHEAPRGALVFQRRNSGDGARIVGREVDTSGGGRSHGAGDVAELNTRRAGRLPSELDSSSSFDGSPWDASHSGTQVHASGPTPSVSGGSRTSGHLRQHRGNGLHARVGGPPSQRDRPTRHYGRENVDVMRSAAQPALEVGAQEPAPALSVPNFEQSEKDDRLVQLMHRAALLGCGDLDLEPAMKVLEDVSWDVDQAIAQISGSNNNAADTLAVSSVMEVEHMRLQMMEWEGAFAAEEIPLQRAGEANMTPEGRDDDRVGLAELRFISSRAPSTDVRGRPESAHRQSYRVRLGHHTATSDDESGGETIHEDPEDMRAVFYEAHAALFEAHAAHAVALRVQDAADLRDAMRISSEETYSGSFGVPPVDETVLDNVTRTSRYAGPIDGDLHSQCVVCLEDFERGDSLRTLRCSHVFHMTCVDQWLAQSAQCPNCKCRVCV